MTDREEPDAATKVVVWVGLAILAVAVGSFVWFFLLGGRFSFG